jgi:hypothetical protein
LKKSKNNSAHNSGGGRRCSCHYLRFPWGVVTTVAGLLFDDIDDCAKAVLYIQRLEI